MTPTEFALTLERPLWASRPRRTATPTSGDERCRNCGKHHGSSPPGTAQSHLGGLCEMSVTPDRRKRVGQTARGRLIEADRPVEVLEPLLAEVS